MRWSETSSLQRSAGESCKEQDAGGQSRTIREVSIYGKSASPACSGEPSPSFFPRRLLPSILEGDGTEKRELNADFLAILVLFPLHLTGQGKELGERFYFWAYNCEIIVYAGLGMLWLEGCSYLNRCGMIRLCYREKELSLQQPNP